MPASDPAPPFGLKGLDHVVVRARDLARMLDWYETVLGCREERRVDKAGLVQLRAGAQLIDLIDSDGPIGRMGGAPPSGDGGGNMDHLCVRVEGFDEAAIRRHLAAHDVEAGPVETRYGAEGAGPSIYIKDPEGNVVELKGPPAPPSDGETMDPSRSKLGE